MLSYATLNKKPKELLALTGLARREFEALLPAFARALPVPRARKKRQRAVGGGRKPALASPADQLLFILVYLKTYPIQAVQAELFGMSQSSANRYLHRLLPVLAAALDELGVLPERDGARLARAAGAGADLIVDGTERRRQRPKKAPMRAVHYSGRKKTHADKNLVVVERSSGQVRYLSPTRPGSVHDKTAAEYERLRYPPDCILRSDLGFYGYAPRVGRHRQVKKA